MSPSPTHVEKVVLAEKFSLFTEQWQPKLLGRVNDTAVKIARLEGEFVWHAHEHEDELFMVIEGELELHLRDQDPVVLRPGEFAIVPRGVEHLPIAREEVLLLMVEPDSTVNTGTAGGDRTVEPEAL